jgi:hypothetical protein
MTFPPLFLVGAAILLSVGSYWAGHTRGLQEGFNKGFRWASNFNYRKRHEQPPIFTTRV